MCRCRFIHLPIDLALHVQFFRGVFLHVVRIFYGISQGSCSGYALHDDVGGFADQPEFVEFFQSFVDQRERLVR